MTKASDSTTAPAAFGLSLMDEVDPKEKTRLTMPNPRFSNSPPYESYTRQDLVAALLRMEALRDQYGAGEVQMLRKLEVATNEANRLAVRAHNLANDVQRLTKDNAELRADLLAAQRAAMAATDRINTLINARKSSPRPSKAEQIPKQASDAL